jgi:protein TonB
MKLRTKLFLTTALLAVAGMAYADSEKHLTPSESIAAAVSKPQPEYPAIAKQLKLEGMVSLTAYVTEEGAVDHVETVSGNPILVRSAEEALKHWKFSKVTDDGKPVKFVASVVFNFKQ